MKVVKTTPQHNRFQFYLKQQFKINISSDFDSGNINKVQFNHPNILTLTPANDCAGTQYEGLSKSWFYFKISGVPFQFTMRFIIKSLHMLSSVAKWSQYYKCVYKSKEQQNWRRVENCIVLTKQLDIELNFDFKFQNSNEFMFAFSFPFSYTQCQNMINSLQKQYRIHKQIYFHNQIIIQSPQKRNINLITITSHQGKQIVKQSRIHQFLFKDFLYRAQKFRSNKKVILITARVHPGETPGSYSMNGIINFLLSKDARAVLLRKFFVFMLIPMLNPDGVYHGYYRMDIFNNNLNRLYLNPDPIKHPSIFAVKRLAQYLTIQNRLFFYLDLHAHAGKKGNFFYGNSLNDFNQQIQTQLFAKLLSLNCVNFQYDNCNFTKKQMTFKDKNQELTKQGCGRVVIYKLMNLPYSYTLECGYHTSSYLNQLSLPANSHRKIQRAGLIYDQYENIKSSIYSEGAPYFNPRIYQNVGKSILITILDIFQQNPYSRIPTSTYKNLQNIKKQIVGHLVKSNEKFKKQQIKYIYNSKKGSETISDNLVTKFEKQGVFQISRSKLRFSHKLTQNISKSKQAIKNIRIRELTVHKIRSKTTFLVK